MNNVTQPFNISNHTIGSNDIGGDELWGPFQLIYSLFEAISEHREEIPWTHTSRLFGIITYSSSLYGITCMAMSVILNRTLVIASTNASNNQQQAINRNRGIMSSPKSAEAMKKLSIASFRIGVIAILLYNAYNISVSLNLHSHVSLSGSVPYLYKFLPDSLFSYDAEYFSSTNYMKTPRTQVMVGPSTDMYWPIFLSCCLSSFTETFVSVVQGKRPYTESSITIFELSLAFQEYSSNGSILLGNNKLHLRPNEQVLVIALFSIMTHLNIHIGGLINDNKYRLIPSSVFGISFLVYYFNSMLERKVLNFPFFFNLMIIPQLLVLLVILASALIFLMALAVHGFKLQELNLASFLMQSDDEISDSLQEHLQDDFYTVLLELGMLAITSAGASSYITELSLVAVDDRTWIERGNYELIPNGKRSGNAKESPEYGYGNVILQPSKELQGGDDDGSKKQTMSVLGKRYKQSTDIVSASFSLLYSIIKSILFGWLPRLVWRALGKSVKDVNSGKVETEEEFEERKKHVPKFLWKYMAQRSDNSVKTRDQKLIEIDDFSQDSIGETYLNLLSGCALSEVDTSENYKYVDSEEESEYSETESISEMIGVSNRIPSSAWQGSSAISELISADEFTELITTDTEILRSHISRDAKLGVLTRSKFTELVRVNQQDRPQQNDSQKLMEIIASSRTAGQNSTDSEDFSSRLDCVICQVNMREIITWPCKCFAICEPCRLSLVAKGIEGCVCCRRNVEGVSKVYIP